MTKIITADYKKIGFDFGHPWEFIYKYMGLICLKKGLERESQNLIDKIDLVEGRAETIELINIYSSIEYYVLKKELIGIDNKKNKKEVKKLDKKINKLKDNMLVRLNKYPNIKENFQTCLGDYGQLNIDKLKEKFTYMYI